MPMIDKKKNKRRKEREQADGTTSGRKRPEPDTSGQ